MKVSRRQFIQDGAVAIGAVTLHSQAQGQRDTSSMKGSLPWEREPALREAAKSVFITHPLNAASAAPPTESVFGGGALQVTNPGIRSTIWGPGHRVTVSMLKNDVWDRRVVQSRYPTVKEVVANAMAPGAAAYKGINSTRTTRPNWGMLMSDGSMVDPLHNNRKALMKIAGQMILSMDDLAGAPQPDLSQSCANGVVDFTVRKGKASARLEYALSMGENVWAIRGQFSGFHQPVSLRLYRNAESQKNDGLEGPTAETDGRYFWVKQRLPAEKTFPNGFEYVLMGLVDEGAQVSVTAENGKTSLGTPSPDAVLRSASGSAGMASFAPVEGQPISMYVAVVSTVDAGDSDVLVAARRLLDATAKAGFDGVAAGNAKWYGSLYDRRERGRIFHGEISSEHGKRLTSEDVPEVFYSWFCKHGGATKTDMRKFQASAHYCVPEVDKQAYSGLPCYNEIFYTHAAVRGRSDAVDMWKQIAEHWRDAARQNAKDVFGLSGMYLTHGFLPPIKPDVYIHTNFALEFAVDTLAQILKPVWDEWDYGGDESFLRNTCYPLMRDMCLFYAGYVSETPDGAYHIVPSMQEECWGFYPGLSHNRDCIAALATFRWAFLRTIEAARLLGCDADLIPQWQQIADHLQPYPTWQKPDGLVFAGLPGVEPLRFGGDHGWDVGAYPTLLTDDINLDSDDITKATMIRTLTLLRSSSSKESMMLLGRELPPVPGRQGDPHRPNDLSLGGGPSPERLINSRSGRIHLFPCVTENQEIAFRHMQTRRGFLVSACRNKRGVSYVEIEARRATRCEIMNPWPGNDVEIRPLKGGHVVASRLDRSNGECVVFEAQRGEVYRLKLVHV